MVHVLEQLKRSVRPGGVVLELHPLPGGPRIEIREGEGRREALARLADPEGDARIRAVRRVVRECARDGALEVVSRRWFDWDLGHESVDAWLERRTLYGATSIIPPGFLARARRSMKPGRMLIVHNRARASVLRMT